MTEPATTPARPPSDPALREYLGQVRSRLPVGSGDDVVRELESSILDRADTIAAERGDATDGAAVRRALAEVGEPEVVAASYVPQGHVVPPEHYRSFLVWTALALAVHLVLIGVATSMGRALHFGPVGVAPVGPHGVLSFGASALHALLVDVGLMVLAFAALPRLRGLVGRGTRRLGVDAAPRAAGGRAALSVLVACVLGLFRDRLFVVMDGPVAHPLFSAWFAQVVPFVLGLLAFAVVVDVLYALLGETRGTVAADALHGAATLAVMVHLLRGEAIFEVPPVAAFADFRGPVNGFLHDLGTLVLGFLAVAAAVKTVRRLVRCAQI